MAAEKTLKAHARRSWHMADDIGAGVYWPGILTWLIAFSGSAQPKHATICLD